MDGNEDCDVPGETGVYSQTIVGRQCNSVCRFGPYCGDGILQTGFDEECDDGNNDDGDFCSALCTVEPAGSGGGGSSGGGGRRGGSDEPLGDTVVSIAGLGYPNSIVRILLDTEEIGRARTDRFGEFSFSADAEPGTATVGLWSQDGNGVSSRTLNNTFDITQGAVTNVTGIVMPPTVVVNTQNINPGDTVLVSGESVPNATIEIVVGAEETFTTSADSSGDWSLELDTGLLPIAAQPLRARSVVDNPPLTSESVFSSSIQLFIGVDGQATTPSDLNRDGSVNLIDFSILIFWWQTNGGNSEPPADINQNGNVGLEDFSILLFNWTG